MLEMKFKTCPFCAEEILSSAIVCKHCGRELDPKRVSEALMGITQPPDVDIVEHVLLEKEFEASALLKKYSPSDDLIKQYYELRLQI